MTLTNATLAKECWDRVVEIYKARLTINTALAVGMVTLTGYGLQSSRIVPLLVSALIPILAFGVDLLMKWRYAAPLFYKLVSLENELTDPEPLGLLFLDFVRASHSKYATIFEAPPTEARRLAFRRRYVLNGVWLRLLLYMGIAMSEALVALFVVRR
jgi:hypothetical protein